MTDNPPPGTQLVEAAQAIHADNLHLLDRLAADDCNPGIELDDTLNGAQDHIFRFFEALALYRYGTVPWRSVKFMLDSTEALVHAVETRFHTPSAHAVGQAFRASKIWWCVDEPAPKVTRKAYLKNLFAARESFYAALNTFNCDLFCQSAPPAAPTPPQRAATKSDNPSAAPPHARAPKPRHGRRGSGLKGNRTRRMVDQLDAFKAWLLGNPVNERDSAKTVGARANAYWRLHEKTMARDAKRMGEKRGFSSAKTLASAYRNS